MLHVALNFLTFLTKRDLTSNKSSHKSSNKPSLKLKRAKYSDMSLVCDFIESSSTWYEKFVEEKDMSEHRPGKAWIDKNFKRRDFYIGYQGEEPVGTISYQDLTDEYAYLGYIYLDVDHVGKGFGKGLIDHAKSIAEEKDKRGMVLIAHPEARWATKAYEKYGFERIARSRQNVLSWQNGALEPYYEEGFELYRYKLK